MTNSLVAPQVNGGSWHTGAGVLDNAMMTVKAIEQGDMLGVGLNGAATAMTALAVVADPFAAAISAGVGWLIEHWPLAKKCLDWLAGDPDQIMQFANTWTNVKSRLAEVAADLLSTVARDTAAWKSEATDQYKAAINNFISGLEGAAEAAGGVSTTITVIGAIVAAVRATVRDLIAQAIGQLISKALQAATIVLAPAAMASIGLKIAEWSMKIMNLIKRMASALGRLGGITQRLGGVFKHFDQTLVIQRNALSRVSAQANAAIVKGNAGSRLRQFGAAYNDLFKVSNGVSGNAAVRQAARSSAAGQAVNSGTGAATGGPAEVRNTHGAGKADDGDPPPTINLDGL